MLSVHARWRPALDAAARYLGFDVGSTRRPPRDRMPSNIPLAIAVANGRRVLRARAFTILAIALTVAPMGAVNAPWVREIMIWLRVL